MELNCIIPKTYTWANIVDTKRITDFTNDMAYATVYCTDYRVWQSPYLTDNIQCASD